MTRSKIAAFALLSAVGCLAMSWALKVRPKMKQQPQLDIALKVGDRVKLIYL
jgi:hypothetical protein